MSNNLTYSNVTSPKMRLSKRIRNTGLCALLLPIAALGFADLANSFTPKTSPYSINLIPFAHAADSSSYETVIAEWQQAKKTLKDAREIRGNVKSTNSKSEADIEKQIQSIVAAEKALNASVVALENAEQNLLQAENSQDDPQGKELKEKLLRRQNELDTAIIKTDAAKQDITKAEAGFLRIKSTVDQLVKAVGSGSL